MLRTPKAIESNSACTTDLKILDKYEPASVEIEWDDKSKMQLNTDEVREREGAARRDQCRS